MNVSIIIPVRNEGKSIGLVLDAIPEKTAREIVVVDNGSTDDSVTIARAKGAKVVHEARQGYGRACLTGLRALDHPEVVVFLDGDMSDFPEELPQLLQPIERGEADFVMGSRILGGWEKGSIQKEVILRNNVACFLIGLLFRRRYTDVGPFRAIRTPALESLRMRDPTHGWHVEMQVRAAKKRLRIVEVPARYRKRLGQSKPSANSRGSVILTLRTFWIILRNLL